jgi:hypothetical protein
MTDSKQIERVSDQINKIVNNYCDGVLLPDIDAWHTADIVLLSTLMDGELQRRAYEAQVQADEFRH